MLRLYRVSRLDMGVYMCIARNGIPPAVSKNIRLNIDCKNGVGHNFLCGSDYSHYPTLSTFVSM